MKLKLKLPTSWLKPLLEDLTEVPLEFDETPIEATFEYSCKDFMPAVKAMIHMAGNAPAVARGIMEAGNILDGTIPYCDNMPEETSDDTSPFTKMREDLDDDDETELAPKD